MIKQVTGDKTTNQIINDYVFNHRRYCNAEKIPIFNDKKTFVSPPTPPTNNTIYI